MSGGLVTSGAIVGGANLLGLGITLASGVRVCIYVRIGVRVGMLYLLVYKTHTCYRYVYITYVKTQTYMHVCKPCAHTSMWTERGQAGLVTDVHAATHYNTLQHTATHYAQGRIWSQTCWAAASSEVSSLTNREREREKACKRKHA